MAGQLAIGHSYVWAAQPGGFPHLFRLGRGAKGKSWAIFDENSPCVLSLIGGICVLDQCIAIVDRQEGCLVVARIPSEQDGLVVVRKRINIPLLGSRFASELDGNSIVISSDTQEGIVIVNPHTAGIEKCDHAFNRITPCRDIYATGSGLYILSARDRNLYTCDLVSGDFSVAVRATDAFTPVLIVNLSGGVSCLGLRAIHGWSVAIDGKYVSIGIESKSSVLGMVEVGGKLWVLCELEDADDPYGWRLDLIECVLGGEAKILMSLSPSGHIILDTKDNTHRGL